MRNLPEMRPSINSYVHAFTLRHVNVENVTIIGEGLQTVYTIRSHNVSQNILIYKMLCNIYWLYVPYMEYLNEL